MSHPAPLQELGQALAAGQAAQAATLGYALAARGELPLIELFGIAALLAAAGSQRPGHRAVPAVAAARRRRRWPTRRSFNLAVLLSARAATPTAPRRPTAPRWPSNPTSRRPS